MQRRPLNSTAAGRRAFTLIEVLVVMGIIAVLLSLLIPALNKSLATARQAHCANNMRQLYGAVMAYAMDNNDTYPIPPSIGNRNASWLAYWMLPANGGDGDIDYANGPFWSYLDPHKPAATDTAPTSSTRYQVFNCPADNDNPRLTRWGTISLYPRNYTYSFNIEIRQRPIGGSVGWRTGVHLGEVVNASKKILIVEEQWPNDGLSFLGWVDETNGNFNTSNPSVSRDKDDVLSARHNGMGNQGFADGHVEAIDPRSLGFNIYNIQYGTTSGPTNTSNLAAATALDLFYK